MKRSTRISAIALLTALVAACASTPHETGDQEKFDYRALLGPKAPGGASGSSGADGPDWPDRVEYLADGPYPVDLADVPVRQFDPNNQLSRRPNVGRPELPIPPEVAERLRERALRLPPQLAVQGPASAAPDALGPTLSGGFDSLDYRDCCGGGGNVPPDPELAVGPNHIIAVVNVAFEIYDKLGGSLTGGPMTFSSFFNGTPGCSNTGVFDPNVVYDEEYDRFILGIDGDGSDYCIAASAPGDPGTWNRYAFTTATSSEFFDYPHLGVGLDAIYLGANIFNMLGPFPSGFKVARVWAIDKLDLYNGGAVNVVSRNTGGESTPQPMNLHGFNQGTWPLSGPHYFLTDGDYQGSLYGVWSWDDPFGADIFGNVGYVDLSAATGIATDFPVDVPQSGGGALQANDWRNQDAEFHDGFIWTVNSVSCNPGGGTVDCVRWAQIDPTVPDVVDAGVYGSDGEYRTFGDLAVNQCGDMAVGYTKTSVDIHPSVFVSGRESGDPPGAMQAEVLMKAGEITYTAFDSAPHRWGDYTEMTIDPDGMTFWYLGEYSKDTGTTNGRWGTYIASFSFDGCSVDPVPPGKATSPSPSNGETDVSIDAVMTWTAGSGATGHVVTFDGIENAEQASASFDPGPLDPNTTYSWRVDEVNINGTTLGDDWSFTTGALPVLPDPATNPSPADGAVDVLITATLGWSAGANADSHNVYFGTDSTPDETEFQGNQAGTTFDPGTLTGSTTYYWRIDEVNADGTTTGTVWSFTSEDVPNPEFYVDSVAVTTATQNGNRVRGVATIMVFDADGAGVANVEVSGTFSGDWDGVRSGLTDGNGKLVLETPPIKNGSNFAFCVDTAVLAGWNFDTATSNPWLCNATPTFGSISGTVSESGSGAPISGASVSADSGQNTTTDGAGTYTLNDVPTGSRDVTVTAGGYNPQMQSTTVTDGVNSPLNFSLTQTGAGGTLQVRSITVSTVNQQGNKSGRAVVVVEADGNVVENASVSGAFSGTFNENAGPAATDASGSVTFDTDGQQKGGVSVTFCVTGITHASYTDFVGSSCASL